jgi:hypothetical protein
LDVKHWASSVVVQARSVVVRARSDAVRAHSDAVRAHSVAKCRVRQDPRDDRHHRPDSAAVPDWGVLLDSDATVPDWDAQLAAVPGLDARHSAMDGLHHRHHHDLRRHHHDHHAGQLLSVGLASTRTGR